MVTHTIPLSKDAQGRVATLSCGRESWMPSAAQFSEKLAQVSHQKFRLFPASEVSSSRHFRVLHQIEGSREHTLGRIQGRQLMRERGEACRYGHLRGEIGTLVCPAPVIPCGGANGVRHEVKHDIREDLVFCEDRLTLVGRIAPAL